MTEYNFAAQYQQNPTPPGGNIVKTEWLRYYTPGTEPKFTHYFQSWDTANKANEMSAYSVCTTWGVTGTKYYLLDVLRKKLLYPDLKKAVIAQHQFYPRSTVIIEDQASGTQLIQELKLEKMRIKQYRPPPNTDKDVRLHIQTINFESGRVLLPIVAPWLQVYIDELTGCPNVKYYDQVDSTTQFLDFINQPGAKPIVISEEALRRAAQPGPYSPYRPSRFF